LTFEINFLKVVTRVVKRYFCNTNFDPGKVKIEITQQTQREKERERERKKSFTMIQKRFLYYFM
jgi:hypothetical protein